MSSDWRRNYWIECVSIGAEECGAVLTREQIEAIADSVQGGHENYSMASGDDVASANLYAARDREKEDLKKEIRREREKVTCRQCNGTGTEVSYGPYHMATTRCFKCNGDGRHDP